jgi:hypothetical protein
MPVTIITDAVTCDDCGEPVPDPAVVDGRSLCECCAEQLPACDECGEAVDSLTATVDDTELCDACLRRLRYVTCEYYACDAVSAFDDMTLTATRDRVCANCADRWYWGCENCGELIDSGDYCEACEIDREYCHLINDYSYKPAPEFQGTGPLYMGVELEISTPSYSLADCAEVAHDRLGSLGYLKEDSSISGSGFELVTHPMSYAWAMRAFPWSLLDELRDESCDGSGNGMHVHISRAAFASPCHIYRWMKFLYRNAENVIAVARRRSDQWAAFRPESRQRVKDYAKGASGHRYSAINTCNRDTFELRVFASTLDRQEVQAALGLAAASVEYTRALSVTDIVSRAGWEWSSFADWVGTRPEYAPLAREMEKRACAC